MGYKVHYKEYQITFTSKLTVHPRIAERPLTPCGRRITEITSTHFLREVTCKACLNILQSDINIARERLEER